MKKVHRGRFKHACGHKGFGKSCHRCAQVEALLAGREKRVEHRGLKMLPALAALPPTDLRIRHLQSTRSARLTSRKDNMPLGFMPKSEKPVKARKSKPSAEEMLAELDPEVA